MSYDGIAAGITAHVKASEYQPGDKQPQCMQARLTRPERIRNAMNSLDELADIDGVHIGLHAVDLYNSVFRFDNQMIVAPHLFRMRGYQHPALHLRKLSPYGIFESIAEQFEQVWDTVQPVKGHRP